MRTVVLTGATSGIGLAAARLFAPDAGCLILHGRQAADKTEPLLGELRRTMGPDARLHYLRADFSDQADVDKLARDLVDLTDRIDLLINNAGCAGPSRRTVLPNGNEVTFQVNYLAPVALTTMLLPLLGTPAGRIVNIASATHYSPPDLDLEDLDRSGHRYSAYNAYANSKLALVAWSCWLARNRPSAQVEVVSMHPGAIATKILHEMVGGGGDPPEVGAAHIRYVAARHGDNGVYYDKRRRVEPNPVASDAVIQDTLHARTSALLRERVSRHPA